MQSDNNAPLNTPPETPSPESVQVNQPNTQGNGGGGIAVAAMIVGIVAVVSGWVPFWGLVVGIVAVVLGVIGLKKSEDKKGMAIAGLVTGAIGALTGLVVTGLMIIGMLGLAAVSNSIDNSIKEADKEVNQQINAKKDFAKGETARFNDIEVTINSVERDHKPASEWSQAGEGKEYVLLNVTVKNVSDEKEYVSPLYFSVNDGGLAVGQSYITVSDELKSGDLSPGASVTGNIPYEVTKGASDLKLEYATTVYSLGEGKSQELTYTLAF